MNHQGIDILFNENNGMFRAVVNGQLVNKNSLKSIKDFIDKSQNSTFKEFDAIRHEDTAKDGTPIFKKVRVIAIRKTGARVYGSKYEFITEPQINSRSKLLLDTPDNRKLYADIMAYGQETRLILDKRRDKESQMRERLDYAVADTMAAEKKK